MGLMSLFRIWPFRILLIFVATLLATDFVLVTTSGRPSTPVALHVVRTDNYTLPAEPPLAQELRGLKRANRSMVRAKPHVKLRPQVRPQVVHVVPKPKIVVVPVGAYGWAHSRKAIGVANCESGPGPHEPKYDVYVGDPHLRDPNGHYGKWQFAPSTADSVGAPGAGIADLSEAQQDYFAWKLWQRDGWSPWECAHLV